MSAPPSFSSFPGLESLHPQQPSSLKEKERDRPSKRARRSVEREEDEDERRRRKDKSSSSSRRDRDRDEDHFERKDRKDRDRDGSHRDRESDRDRDKRKEKERSLSKHHSSSSHRSRPVTPPPPPSPSPAASTLFYKDTRGDEANKTYGSLHGPSVAKFYRSGGELRPFLPFSLRTELTISRLACFLSAGNIIGFPRGVKITRASSRAGGKTLEVEWNKPQGGSYSVSFAFPSSQHFASLSSFNDAELILLHG